MDYKKLFWATKEKIALTLILFVLATVFFMPVDKTSCPECVSCPNPCGFKFMNILEFASVFGEGYWLNIYTEIVYLGFSYLAACIVFHMKNKGGK